MKIAVWSGPRNLSTALMYAFANRPDMTAWDEPFYGAYLAQTGVIHPMQDEIISTQRADELDVLNDLFDPSQNTTKHSYFKLMTHHMQPTWPLDWTNECVNIHLIRHPARVIASYAAKRQNPTLQDIGFPQQSALFDRIGGIVIDSDDIRQDPENTLKNLCAQINLPFDPAMLHWPAGPRDFDGIWASHWYNAVHQSTGFAAAEGQLPELKGTAADLLAAALPFYEKLNSFRSLL